MGGGPLPAIVFILEAWTVLSCDDTKMVLILSLSSGNPQPDKGENNCDKPSCQTDSDKAQVEIRKTFTDFECNSNPLEGEGRF